MNAPELPEKKVPVVRCVRIWPWQRRRYAREGYAVGEGWLPFAARREMVIAHGSIVMLEPDQRLDHEERKMQESDADLAAKVKEATMALAGAINAAAERGLLVRLDAQQFSAIGKQQTYLLAVQVSRPL